MSRRLLAFIACLVALASPACATSIVTIPDNGRAHLVLKLCGPVGPKDKQAIVMVPQGWTNVDCHHFARTLGTDNYRLGCLFELPSGPGGQKIVWGNVNATAPSKRNCGWPSTDNAKGFTAKLCSSTVRGDWRSITFAHASWTPQDCRDFARAIGATEVQLGCLFDAPVGAEQFAWAQRATDLGSRPVRSSEIPSADCGWQKPEPKAISTPILKICSAFIGEDHQISTTVIIAWTPADCRSLARMLHASGYRLGCSFETPQETSGQKFLFGRRVGIAGDVAPEDLPHGCAWR